MGKFFPGDETQYHAVSRVGAEWSVLRRKVRSSRRSLALTDAWGKKLEGAPLSAKVREELLKYQAANDSEAPQYAGDEISRRLDTITLEDYRIKSHGITRDTYRTFFSMDDGGGYGLGGDALSGFTAYAADMLHPLDISDETGQQMFPDGNGGIARLITKTLIPECNRR